MNERTGAIGQAARSLPPVVRRAHESMRPTWTRLREGVSRLSRAGVIASVRTYDFTAYSDEDLRLLLGRLRPRAREQGGAEVLCEVFAIVGEAVSRRMGAWRLFDPAFDKQGLAVYEELTNRILDSARYRDRVDYYIGHDFLHGEDFHKTLAPLLDEMALDEAERTIVKTAVYVAEKSALTYQPDILLPAEFYQALADKDTEGVLRFQVTDEQLMAGLSLYQGRVVEMQSGEGKTVAAAFPAVLHIMSGRSVHIMTANDYLSLRDAEWLTPVYESLGLNVFAVLEHMTDEERKTAYRGEIVYGTLREFGFDFLRDNLKYSRDDLVQGELDVAIIDEADHALIDEARTPLIIAGGASGARMRVHRVREAVERLIALHMDVVRDLERSVRRSGTGSREHLTALGRLLLAQPENALLLRHLTTGPDTYKRIRSVINDSDFEDSRRSLTRDLYYEVDEESRFVTLTAKGQEFLDVTLGSLFDTGALEARLDSVDADDDVGLASRRQEIERLGRRLSRQHNVMNQVHQMLRAYLLLERDVDYVVVDDSVVLVDEATGRTKQDSRYQHGLQEALEAKEGVTVCSQGQVLAQISVQGFVGQYASVAGMTGTALVAQDEFAKLYGLEVVDIPRTRRSRRSDLQPTLYVTRNDKLKAAVDEVKLCQRVGRPVLVAALTVEQSKEIGALLRQNGITHNLLNAETDFDEARIVRDAGAYGVVTVATNMAGRGTDILLEPGLSDRIASGYVDLVDELLSEEHGRVVLRCSTREEAEVLRSKLGGSALPALSRARVNVDEFEISVESDPQHAAQANTVSLEAGLGLHVIGTEMNESARTDVQIRGRTGRQGEYGSSRFILSLEDVLLRFRGDAIDHVPDSVGADSSGRLGPQGQGSARRLDRVQTVVEQEVEAQRGAAVEFARVLESLTLGYFRSRRELLASGSLHSMSIGHARGRARRLVDQHLPPSGGYEYHGRFDMLADEVWTDYQVDCSALMGVGLDQLAAELGDLLVARLERARAAAGDRKWDRLQKLVYLQTSDDLWSVHLAHAQDLMATAAVSHQGLKRAQAELAFDSFDAYTLFRQEVIDVFLPRLLTFSLEGDKPEVPALESQRAGGLLEVLA